MPMKLPQLQLSLSNSVKKRQSKGNTSNNWNLKSRNYGSGPMRRRRNVIVFKLTLPKHDRKLLTVRNSVSVLRTWY